MQKVCYETKVQCLVPLLMLLHDGTVRTILKSKNRHVFFRHKDNGLINLVLTDADWNCVAELIGSSCALKRSKFVGV
jgi:hypothetical protein